jgi:hypothetical protein
MRRFPPFSVATWKVFEDCSVLGLLVVILEGVTRLLLFRGDKEDPWLNGSDAESRAALRLRYSAMVSKISLRSTTVSFYTVQRWLILMKLWQLFDSLVDVDGGSVAICKTRLRQVT